ncbi:MAG: BMP family ABC transporter substrate-binding protein [Chloroflexota bacterium]|nr:BMP family ABC transporter substrate-binding protein [Chloroflexota bacterium]
MVAVVGLSSCGAAGDQAQRRDLANLTVTTISPPAPPAASPRLPEGLRVAFVSSSNGINDGGLNAQVVESVRRAAAGRGPEPAVFSSADQADYAANLAAAASQADVVIGLGAGMAGPMTDAARAHRRTAFALLDAPPGQPTLPNVRWLTFDTDQMVFLAGAASAALSHHHAAGFVGGQKTAAQRALLQAFQAGARFLDPGMAVVSAFVGGDNDQVTAKRLAQSLMGQNADVLFGSTFVNGLGVIAAASQARRTAVGFERDEFLVAPNAVATSVLKRTDVAAAAAIADELDGRRSGGRKLGMKDGAVGLAPFHTAGLIDPHLVQRLSEAERQLSQGAIP